MNARTDAALKAAEADVRNGGATSRTIRARYAVASFRRYPLAEVLQRAHDNGQCCGRTLAEVIAEHGEPQCQVAMLVSLQKSLGHLDGIRKSLTALFLVLMCLPVWAALALCSLGGIRDALVASVPAHPQLDRPAERVEADARPEHPVLAQATHGPARRRRVVGAAHQVGPFDGALIPYLGFEPLPHVASPAPESASVARVVQP